MIRNERSADIALIITAIVWGSGFIATEYAIKTGASTLMILSMRFIFASIVLKIVWSKHLKSISKETLKVGCIAGLLLFFGFFLQTFGQSMTSVSNSSFITATNVVMVPFVVWIFTKKSPQLKFFILGFTALLGTSILSVNPAQSTSLNIGDILMLLSALCFAVHIAYLGIYAKNHDSKQLTFLQLSIAGILALICLLAFDTKNIDVNIAIKAIPYTLYLAIFSSCFCYYMQTKAQQYTSPSKAAIILCTEGLFGSIFAVLLGLDTLTASLVIGGSIIFISVITSEIDFKRIN